jgi:hypothetical protein
MPGVIAGGVKKALAGSLGHFLITWVLNNGSYICGASVAPYQSHHSRANMPKQNPKKRRITLFYEAGSPDRCR